MKLCTSREAADALGINHVTLLKYINLGKIKARKAMIGQGWRFTQGDVDAIRKWREAPLAILDLVKAADETPELLLQMHAHLRPDLKLFERAFHGSYPFGEEHPKRLLPHLANGPTPPWSILESQEYLDALAAKRAKDAATPARPLSPEQADAHARYEQWEKEQNE